MIEATDPVREVALASIVEALVAWCDSKRQKNGSINANLLCAGLYITGQLEKHYPLEKKHYLSDSQVKGASGPAAAAILRKHGEQRKFLREGGRTSRKTMPYAIELAELFNNAPDLRELQMRHLADLPVVASRLQGWFVEQIRIEYFSKQRVRAEFNSNLSTKAIVGRLLTSARDAGGNTAGAVAQHLVGARLAIRFPELQVSNDSYTTADAQTSRPGDFQIHDAAFHVTMSPTMPLIEGRCGANVRNGFRPWVLVPQDRVIAALQMVEIAELGDYVTVQSLEDFIGTGVEELSTFSGSQIRTCLRLLLDTYNQRAGTVESDPSLLIELPTNL